VQAQRCPCYHHVQWRSDSRNLQHSSLNSLATLLLVFEVARARELVRRSAFPAGALQNFSPYTDNAEVDGIFS